MAEENFQWTLGFGHIHPVCVMKQKATHPS